MAPFLKLTVILSSTEWPKLEDLLIDHDAEGVTLSKVTGFGNCRNTFRNDLLNESLKVEIFTTKIKAEELAGLLVKFLKSHGNRPNHGVVALTPVDELFNS